MKKRYSNITVIIILLLLLGMAQYTSDWLEKTRVNIFQSQTPKQTSTNSAPVENSLQGPYKTIYLTMDMDISEWMYQQHENGRVPDWYDPGVFDYLIQNKIPATFFVSGLFAQTYPALMEKLNATGDYSFQNHSYDESSFTPDCYQLPALTTDQEKTEQIEETQNILKNLTGHTPTQFRFPGDCHSPADDLLVKNLGLTINNGTIVAGDPFNADTEAIVGTILSQAKNNSVILMHVGGQNAPKSLEVLERIVPTLEKEGFVFEKMN